MSYLQPVYVLSGMNTFEYFRFTFGYVYYAISFNVQKLSGNLFINMFALQMVDIPGNLVTIYLNNK